jgi:tetratricopeptide (TPR) repeat protein
MMARKLSVIASLTALSLAANLSFALLQARAEGEVQSTAPKAVVDNPYAPSVASQPTPRVVAEEPESAPRGPVTYQNPFAHQSKAPPIDSSQRPGPASRWQRPLIPNSEPSAVKSAILSKSSPQTAKTAEPAHLNWDQLPPTENLRQRFPGTNQADSPNLSHLADPDPIIKSTPIALAQPESVTSQSDDASPLDFKHPVIPSDASGQSTAPSSATSATIAIPSSVPAGKINAAFSLDERDQSLELAAHEEASTTSAVASGNPTDDWVKKAQDAAAHAETPDQLGNIISVCEHGLQETPDAESQLSLQRLSAWAHNRRGEILADEQKSDDAIQDFQAAISMDPNCSLAIHNQGVTLAQRNQYGAALRDFNRVIELNPGLAVAYRNRAELLAALGRMEEAVADYNQAISSLPEDPSLLRARAHAYQRLGDFQHASADLTRAIQMAPNDPDLITQRGNLAAEQGKFEAARDDFRNAIAKDTERADAYRSLAWLQATCSDPRYRDSDQSLAHAEKAAKLSPEDDYLVLDTLAAANACSGNFPNAIDLEEKAIAAAPRDLSTPLEQRLLLYQTNKPFTSAPARSKVQPVSHEATAQKPKSQSLPSSVPQSR